MATEIVTSFWQICDDAGDPVSGALVHVYDVGTTTHQNLFSDTGLSVAVANPIVCDSAGRHAMRYKAAGSYKILVTTSAAVTLYERDGIDGRIPIGSGALAIANGGTSATTAPAALAALGGATAAELADLAADVAAITGALGSTEKTHLATGNTAQRPVTPVEGDIRRNTDTDRYEGYNGTAWQNFAMSPPTRQIFLTGTAATYTTPAGCVKIFVRMIAGGGGGGAEATNAGTVGGTTIFNSINANGGSGGASGATGVGGLGGTGGSGVATLRLEGGDGGPGDSAGDHSGSGGSGAFGGAARGVRAAAGANAKANTGGGGGGGDGTASGGGGGAGEYVEIDILAPAPTYSYTVGGGGAGGVAGTTAGGNGGSGIIIVNESY